MGVLDRVIIAAMLALVACGCGRDEPRGAQPSPSETSFEQGKFDELPVYPRSEPTSGRNEKDGVVSRSYRAWGTTPETLFDFYADKLESAGWDRSKPTSPIGSRHRADWITDEYHLEVTASQIADRQNPASDDFILQYNLVLRRR